jgi:hypothetical protein
MAAAIRGTSTICHPVGAEALIRFEALNSRKRSPAGCSVSAHFETLRRASEGARRRRKAGALRPAIGGAEPPHGQHRSTAACGQLLAVGCGTHAGELAEWCLLVSSRVRVLHAAALVASVRRVAAPPSENDGLMVSARSSLRCSSTGSTPRSRASRALEALRLAAAGLRVIERAPPASARPRREASRERRTPVAQPRARAPGLPGSTRPRAHSPRAQRGRPRRRAARRRPAAARTRAAPCH